MRKLTAALAILATSTVFSSTVAAATLQMDKGFFATANNGKLVSTHQHNLSLTDGKQVVTVHHEQLVHLSRERSSFQVEGAMHLVFDAEAGTTYTLEKTDTGVRIMDSNGDVPVTIYNDRQAINKSLL